MLENDFHHITQHPSNDSKVVQFHARNALAILVILLGMIASFLILLVTQYQKSEKLSYESLNRHFSERVIHLDSLLNQVANHIRDMRKVAEADFLETRINKDFKMPGVFHFLKNAENSSFNMDQISPPFTKEMVGNLTGDGNILNRHRDFYREVRMALYLNPLFRSARESIKTAAWAYYISAENFINLYPWVASDDWKFSRESFDKEFFTLALPENNPDRKAFWTQVYLDEVGKGLMTTFGTPIYDEEKFLGVVALDLTVDFLNAIVVNFRPEQGAMFLVNDRNQLLAHPKLTASNHKSIKHISDATPSAIKQINIELDQMPSGEIGQIGGYLVAKADLQNAPWKAFYIEPVPSLLSAFISHVGLSAIILLCGLLFLVVTVLAVNHLFFVLPAEKFVRFILIRNNWEYSGLSWQVPRMWKPWFHIVDDTFRKNEDLTKEIQNHSSLLEQKVKQRTLELEELNAQLRMEIAERKGAEDALKWAQGLETQIKFTLYDWGQNTDPTVYLRNIGSNSVPVPEPATIFLLGTSLIGLVGYQHHRRNPKSNQAHISGRYSAVLHSGRCKSGSFWRITAQGCQQRGRFPHEVKFFWF